MYPFETKLSRLALGEKPRVLELCSGCGGLALGLQSAGFELSAHIEADAAANETYALNFAPNDEGGRSVWSKPRDMQTQSLTNLLLDFKIPGSISGAFDVVAAGLPCQAFARIGRSKLRSVSGDQHAFKNDPRASLYRRFLEIVSEAKPLVILLENVPDILNFDRRNIPEEIAETLSTRGYRTTYTILNSAFYGVPQLRERLFLVAVHTSLGIMPTMPNCSHTMTLPSGYEGSRKVALKYIEGARYFAPIPIPGDSLRSSVSVQEAIADLPFISEHFRDPIAMKRRKVSDQLPYRVSDSISEYAKLMRSWLSKASESTVDGNVVRITPRDFPTFAKMPAGADYPVAVQVATNLFHEKLTSEKNCPKEGSERYNELWNATVPPYDASKFPNKWWKMSPKLPSRTLTAHLGKDTYSHIHYDSRQKRMLSVREAARLQSFPDGFLFAGAMNVSFKQIGNAVPPLLSLAVANSIRLSLDEATALYRQSIKSVA